MSIEIWQRRNQELVQELSRYKRLIRTLHDILELSRNQWIAHHKCTCPDCVRAAQRLDAGWMTTKPVWPDK